MSLIGINGMYFHDATKRDQIQHNVPGRTSKWDQTGHHHVNPQNSAGDPFQSIWVDWCDDPDGFYNPGRAGHNQQPIRGFYPAGGSVEWSFVNETPQDEPQYAQRIPTKRGSSAQLACVPCRRAKAKCCREDDLGPCERCIAKGIKCELVPKSDRPPVRRGKGRTNCHNLQPRMKMEKCPNLIMRTPIQRDDATPTLALAAKASRPSKCKRPIKQPLDALGAAPTKKSRMQKVASAVREAFSGCLDRINMVWDAVQARMSIVGNMGGCKWLATYMILRKIAVASERDPHCILDSAWLSNERKVQNCFLRYVTEQIMGKGVNQMCSNARQSLEKDCQNQQISIETMQSTSSWVPQLPQMNGPNAVFLTTSVLGKVTKYSNSAWDSMFRNKDELHRYLQNSTAATKSPLVEFGLFALIGLIDPEQESVVAKQYCWSMLSWQSFLVADESEVAYYYSCTDFESTCTDKWGNKIECTILIDYCLLNYGARSSRMIQCIPK